MTPTCQQLIDFLDDYIAGDLPTDRIEGFESHLSRCPSCVAYVASYRETIRIAQHTFRVGINIEIEDIPTDLLTAILATVTTRK
jgi:anti-sigma factor RsiW